MAKKLEMTVFLDFYGEMLTEKQRDLVGYYYNNDLSLSEIAENEGITRQGVRDSIKRAEAQLIEMEERLCFVNRFREIESIVEQIISNAKAISNSSNDDVCQYADSICCLADSILHL